VGLSTIIAGSLAAAVVTLALPAQAPATLASAHPADKAIVTERPFDDRRQVQLNIITGAPRLITSPRDGRLTALDCRAGDALKSGTAPIAVDGRRLIALSTDAPLWRTIVLDDTGNDVAGLQAELGRLGHPGAVDGVMGVSTLRALAALRSALDLPADPSPTVDPRDFLWIPDPEVRISGCDAAVGAPVADGDVLLRLPVRIVSAQLSAVPRAAVPGPRMVRSGNAMVPVDERGAVAGDDALSTIAALPEFAAAVGSGRDDPSLPMSWELATPVSTLVVPPASLWDVREGTACIQPVTGKPRLVRLLGSDLGQSFVATGGDAPIRAVRIRPPTGRSCR